MNVNVLCTTMNLLRHFTNCDTHRVDIDERQTNTDNRRYDDVSAETNKNVGPPYCRAGRVECCPLASHGE